MPDHRTRTTRRVTAEGEGRAVGRVARKFDARASVTFGTDQGAPSLTLTVSPSGVWELEHRHYGAGIQRTTIARGRINCGGFIVDATGDDDDLDAIAALFTHTNEGEENR